MIEIMYKFFSWRSHSFQFNKLHRYTAIICWIIHTTAWIILYTYRVEVIQLQTYLSALRFFQRYTAYRRLGAACWLWREILRALVRAHRWISSALPVHFHWDGLSSSENERRNISKYYPALHIQRVYLTNFNGAFLCFLDNFCAVLFISAGYHLFLVLFRRKFSFVRIFATSIECWRNVRSKSFVSSVFMSFKISCRRFWSSLLSREFNAIIFLFIISC